MGVWADALDVDRTAECSSCGRPAPVDVCVRGDKSMTVALRLCVVCGTGLVDSLITAIASCRPDPTPIEVAADLVVDVKMPADGFVIPGVPRSVVVFDSADESRVT